MGKKEAIIEANTPTTKTLRPVKEKSVDFDNTQNIYIEGDNLEALKILQESYLNKVKCIYIDPPYNTGNDFIYNDNFSKTKEQEQEDSGEIDEENNRLVQNSTSNGRYHSDWLSMMYPRLKLARNLLTDDGVIFISINKYEETNLSKVCDEIFGESNFISKIIWRKNKLVMKGNNTFKNVVEPILVYAKNINNVEFNYKTNEENLSDFSVISSGYGEKEILFKKGMLKNNFGDGVCPKGKYPSLKLLDDLIFVNGENNNDVRIIGEFKWSQEKIYEKINDNAYILIKNKEKMTPRIYFRTDTSKPLDYIDERYNVGTNESRFKRIKEIKIK